MIVGLVILSPNEFWISTFLMGCVLNPPLLIERLVLDKNSP